MGKGRDCAVLKLRRICPDIITLRLSFVCMNMTVFLDRQRNINELGCRFRLETTASELKVIRRNSLTGL